jgi:hypothetical protein
VDVINAVNLWGPALLVCLTAVLGVIWGNSRMNDLRSYIDTRFNAQDKRFDDMKDLIRSEVRRLEERMNPIHRS